MRTVVAIILFMHFSGIASDSLRTLHAGAAFRKVAGFYWMNGITAEWSPEPFRKRKLAVAATIVHSSLGSAMFSRAIPVFIGEVSTYWDPLKKKRLHPRLGLSAGYAFASFGKEFAALPAQSATASLEAGLSAIVYRRFHSSLTLGYNLITGEGSRGAGFLYPLFLQAKVTYWLF